MTAEIEDLEPNEVRAGDTVKWKKYIADYVPADGWTLYYAINNSSALIEITTTDNGDGYHLVNEAPATTETWGSGVYKWQSYVSDGTDRYTIETGTIEILPDLTDGATDTRSIVKRTLDAIEAVIENRASIDQQSYTIAGRSLSRMSVEELLTLRDKYKSEYLQELQAEKIERGLGTKNKIKVRFT